MGLSFRFGLRKKMKRSKLEGRGKRNRGALFKPDSRPAVAVAAAEFPEDVLVEILWRLPADSLMRFKCVSKHWSSIISSRYLANLFSKAPSRLRERRRFLYLVVKDGHGEYALLSASPQNLAAREFCVLDKDVSIPGVGGCFVDAVRGLMCFRTGGRRLRICNLTTKQHVELPLVKSSDDDSSMWNHFGYDPIQDEYKVLSLVWNITQERWEQQVLVLGPGASWRRITQSVAPHRPYSQGISIDGVLYYGALTGGESSTCVLVSFDMNREDFNFIELPLEAGIMWDTRATNLMNYRGKVTVFDYSRLSTEGTMDLWVVEDPGKSQWSNKKTFVLPVSDIRYLLEG